MAKAGAQEILNGWERKPCPEADLPTPEMLEEEAQKVSGAMAAFRHELLGRLDPEGAIWPLPPPGGGREAPEGREEPKPGTARTVGFSPFYYYPFLFASAFPGVDAERLRLLARANRFLLEAVLVLDSRMDTDRTVDPLDLHLLDAHYHRALEILVPVLPPDSGFWPQCRDLYVRYGRSVIRELLFHRFRLGPYPVEEFRTISAGKAALLQSTVLALCAWTGQEQHRNGLAASQEAFLSGFQAIDDLKDWREDYVRQNYTYLLTRVLTRGGWVRNVETGCGPPTEDVGRALHFHGSAEEQLDLAENLFQEAIGAVSSIPVPLWTEVLEAYLAGTRAMRADMAEIRRRERIRAVRMSAASLVKGSAPGTTREKIERSVTRGIRFLADRQQPGGAFSLAWSPNAYMQPSKFTGPSAAATELVNRSLAVMEEGDPVASVLRRKASAWLACAATHKELCLDPLERAFCSSSESWVRAARVYVKKGRVEEVEFPLPQEALVAEVLYRAAIEKIAAPALDLSVFESFLGGPWWRQVDSGAVDLGAEKRGFLRPLVVSYLFCRAWEVSVEAGRRLRALEILRDRILGEDPQIVVRAHLTDVALMLACLERTYGPTGRLIPFVERLLYGQEADGSWPANAFYVRGRRCYGSRDVTTAWCSEALFLHLKKLRSLRRNPRPVRVAPPRGGPVTIELHAGVNPKIVPELKQQADRCALSLPLAEGVRIYVGRWEGMASHFVILRGGQPILALQAGCRGNPGWSAAGRPLEAELALGWVEAAWKSSGRSLCGWKERLFVVGLGMMLCRRLWPSQTPWVQAGLSSLEWRWCRENEWFLREWIRRLLYRPTKESYCERPLEGLCRPSLLGSMDKAFSYLGLRLFDGECKEAGLRRDFRSHLEETGVEIDRRIRSLWGNGGVEKPSRVGKQ